jgi:hypothetical protein
MNGEHTKPRETLSEEKNLKAATLKAADFIEANPKLFDFGETDVPHTCKSPGCALGWIHHFSKIKGTKYGPKSYVIEAANLFNISDGVFYERMDSFPDSYRWKDEPAICAAMLRLYAERFL